MLNHGRLVVWLVFYHTLLATRYIKPIIVRLPSFKRARCQLSVSHAPSSKPGAMNWKRILLTYGGNCWHLGATDNTQYTATTDLKGINKFLIITLEFLLLRHIKQMTWNTIYICQLIPTRAVFISVCASSYKLYMSCSAYSFKALSESNKANRNFFLACYLRRLFFVCTFSPYLSACVCVFLRVSACVCVCLRVFFFACVFSRVRLF